MKKICVLGMGYIGLPTAAMFATHGFEVIGVDVNPRTVGILNSGDIHIEEPGLKTVVQAAILSGNLIVRERPETADAFILAVPTPLVGEGSQHSGNHAQGGHAQGGQPRAELSYVRAAAESVVPYLKKGDLVILESTSPPGTTEHTVVPALEQSGLKVGEDLFVAHCPERVLPGRILEELVTNDRVIGGINSASAEMAKTLYTAFVQGPIFLTDATTAEMVKLMENTYRDVNIALANELALVAEQVGINVWDAIEMANRHPRVNIHRPGPGVGGHCIAVDPWFIAAAAPEITPLIQTARRVNDEMPAHVCKLVKKATEGIEKPVIACLGLAYKADVDDTRESPSVVIVHQLQEAGLEVRAHDPHVEVEVAGIHSQVASLDDAVNGADCIVVLTDHSEFRGLEPGTLGVFQGKSIVDTRNIVSAEAWEPSNVVVWQVGDVPAA